MNVSDNCTYCSYCLRAFTLHYIKCTDCQDVFLCVTCFSFGVQGSLHKRNHSYKIQVCNVSAKLLMFGDWIPEEELQLISATELYGIGNWNDIADMVRTHSADECREHYVTYYINGQIGQHLLPKSVDRKSKLRDHSVNYVGNVDTLKLSPSLFDVLPRCHLSSDNQIMLGYMSRRDDFEREYDNDAESILCRLKPDFFKDELLDAIKVAHVGIYTHRLKERQRRKATASEHDLISPIVARILNKPWKPTISEEPLSTDKFNMNKPFTILSSNVLTASFGEAQKQSRHLAKKVEISPIKKGRYEDNRQSKPYDAFMINQNLKPFLRYLTYSQGKALFENLHREEILKCEILTIIDALKRGKRRVLEIPFSYPTVSSVFARTRPKLSNHDETNIQPLLCEHSVTDQIRKRKRSKSFFY